MTSTEDDRYRAADATDRRHALSVAASLRQWEPGDENWLRAAENAYRWLRQRDSLRAVAVVLCPGTPQPEGTDPMATIFDLSDTDQVTFTIGGLDAKGAPVAAPADTWAWNLQDPDSTGAVLTVSDDTLSATVAAGTPDTTGTLLLTITGATTGLTGAEAILVQPSAVETIALVPGTPSPESAPVPPPS